MRILFMGNNWLGWQVLKWLKERNEEIVGLVIHPPQKQRFANEIKNCVELPRERVFDGSQLREENVMQAIRELDPDVGLSVMFGYILEPEFIHIFPYGVINLHPAYLPYNRGAYPNVWSIVDGTPAGATIHYIDPGIDTGDIISQKEVPVESVDTGGSLYDKLIAASLDLFKETWPDIKAGKHRAVKQPQGQGTYHRTEDVEEIDEIELDRQYTARELIDVIRARTFPPYPGAFFREDGNKVHMRMQLLYENELRSDDDDGTN